MLYNIYCEDCVDLISNMLIVDGNKRFTMEQIINHRWMRPPGEEEEDEQFRVLLQEHSVDSSKPPANTNSDDDSSDDSLKDQVLDYMMHLGLDRQRTLEVREESVGTILSPYVIYNFFQCIL